MSQQLISLLKEIGRVKIDLNALATSEDGDSETKRLELQAQLDKLMMEHAQLMKGGEKDAQQAPETGEGPTTATFEEKERHFRAKAPATNGHRGELARLLERQRRKASEEGLNFTAGGAVSTADAFAEGIQKEELSQEASEGHKQDSAAQDLPGAVDGAVRETRSDSADEAQVTYPPSPPSPASPAPWDEDTMIIHHVLPGVAGTSGPAAASLDSVAEQVQELDEVPGEVPETRGMGGRSMSGSSVRFQQEPDVVHFDTDSPAREDRLAIAAPEAVAAPPVTAVTPPAAEAEAQVPEASIEPAAKAEAQDPEATVEPAAEAEAQDPETVIEPEPAQLLVPEPGITDTPRPLADAAREKVAANLPAAAEATDTPPKMEVEVVETQPSAKEAPGLMREAPKEAEDAEAEIAKPSLAAAAGLATAKTPKAEGEKPTSGKAPKAGMTAQTVHSAAKRRPAPKAASVPKAAPHPKKEVAAKPTPPAPKAAPPAAKATQSTGKAASAKPKAAQHRARSHDERQQRQPGSRRHSAEVSKATSDALSAAVQEKPKPAWGGSGKLVARPAAEVRRASPRPKAVTSKPTKAASSADLRPAPEKLGAAQPPAQEKAPSQVVSHAKAPSKRRVSEGQAALEKMAKDLEKNVKAAQALCLRESEKCAVRHMKAAEAEAAAVRQAMALQAAVSSPEKPQSPIKDTKESESPAIAAEPVSQRSGSLRLALADLVQQEDTDDAQLAMAVQRVLGDSLPSSPSHSSSRHSGLLTQSSPQLLVSHEVPLRIGSKPRSASGSPRHSHKELPKQDEGPKKKVVKSSPAHRPGRGEDSPPRAGSPPRRTQQCQPATASKITPRKKVDERPAWDDRFFVVEAKKHHLRKSELDEDVPHEDEVQQETPQRRVRSRSPTTEAAKAPQGAAPEKRPAPKPKGKSKAHEKARTAPASPEAQAQAAVSPRSQVPAERFAADRAVRQAGGSSPRR